MYKYAVYVNRCTIRVYFKFIVCCDSVILYDAKKERLSDYKREFIREMKHMLGSKLVNYAVYESLINSPVCSEADHILCVISSYSILGKWEIRLS